MPLKSLTLHSIRKKLYPKWKGKPFGLTFHFGCNVLCIECKVKLLKDSYVWCFPFNSPTLHSIHQRLYPIWKGKPLGLTFHFKHNLSWIECKVKLSKGPCLPFNSPTLHPVYKRLYSEKKGKPNGFLFQSGYNLLYIECMVKLLKGETCPLII